VTPAATEIESLRPLCAEGLVAIDRTFIRIPERGRPFVRLVAAAFDAYLEQGAARHSRAV
jgi:oxygen-independent coproporphyrinogen III oxidase